MDHEPPSFTEIFSEEKKVEKQKNVIFSKHVYTNTLTTKSSYHSPIFSKEETCCKHRSPCDGPSQDLRLDGPFTLWVRVSAVWPVILRLVPFGVRWLLAFGLGCFVLLLRTCFLRSSGISGLWAWWSLLLGVAPSGVW